MSMCSITGKKRMSGNRVSHSNRKCKRGIKPNVFKKKIFDVKTSRYHRINISSRALRSLSKMSFSELLSKYDGNK